MSDLKLKEPVPAALFDPHVGKATPSRTSNTYGGLGTQHTTFVPAARLAAFQLPSRMGNRLHYPNGTVKEMEHDPHSTTA